jgi:DNA-binding transcriptional LysR family regulator
MNAPLPSPWPPPLDLYGLGLLRMVARHGSMTRAASDAGLTQSALTRQVQGMEQRLGVELFDRTTRRVHLTAAGETLLRDTAGILPLMDEALRRLGQEHLAAPREVRIGVSRSIAFSHLPGLLHAHLRRSSHVRTTVEHLSSAGLLAKVESGKLDVGVLCPPRRLPSSVSLTHRMEDVFHLIAPASLTVPDFAKQGKRWPARLTGWLERQSWLLLSRDSQTGAQLRQWLKERSLTPEAAMEPDNFDLIIHLVALGLGISLVPRRAIAAFPRRRLLRRIPLPEEFRRTLAVIVPRSSKMPPHVEEFVGNILFS